MNNREISIARLNAKIYTQRTALINYQDLLQEKKAELVKLKQQLAIAVKALKYIYDDTKKGHTQCNACGYCSSCETCINADWAEKALKQIKELEK